MLPPVAALACSLIFLVASCLVCLVSFCDRVVGNFTLFRGGEGGFLAGNSRPFCFFLPWEGDSDSVSYP